VTHELKCWTEFFVPLWIGAKTFEIRRNDRNFRQGDTLRLIEWDREQQRPTGLTLDRRIIYMTDFQQQPGYVVLGIAP